MIAIIIVLIPVSLATTTTHHQNMSEIAKYDNGSTVFAGDNVIDKNYADFMLISITIFLFANYQYFNTIFAAKKVLINSRLQAL